MSLNERRNLYKQIHIKANQLGLTDSAYRNVLYAVTGQRSCTTMRPEELKTVLHFLNSYTAPKQAPETVTDDEALAILGLVA